MRHSDHARPLRLTRRSAIAGLASLAAAACASPMRSGRGSVVVVGAGLAGLSAAYELQRAGLDVRLIEQSDRPGGRVYSVRNQFADDLVVELGGVEVATSYTNFVRYCDLLGVGYEKAEPSPRGRDVLLDERGSVHKLSALRGSDDWPLDVSPAERAGVPFGLLGSYLAPVARQIGTLDQLLAPQFQHFDAMTLRQFLLQAGASNPAIAFIDRTLNYNSVDTVSALGALRDMVRRFAAPEAQSLHLPGGNSNLPEAFAAQLRDCIYYNTSLRGVRDDGGRVQLSVTTSMGEEHWQADHVVLAVPVPVLRNVDLIGALSEPQRAMIDALPYTQISRTYLQTPTLFWSPDAAVSAIYSDGPLERFFDLSHWLGSGRGLLQNWVNGTGTKNIAHMDNVARTRFIIEHMQRIWPQWDATIDASLSIDWGQMYSEGAYAHFAPGQVHRFANVMQAPAGHLHFAGEHTEFEQAGLEGALTSGRRAAEQVLDALVNA